MSVDEIFREAHLLSVEDRMLLADSLLDSIDPPDPKVEAEWMRVVRRRDGELESGQAQAIPGDEFLAEMKRRFPNL